MVCLYNFVITLKSFFIIVGELYVSLLFAGKTFAAHHILHDLKIGKVLHTGFVTQESRWGHVSYFRNQEKNLAKHFDLSFLIGK